MYGCVQKKIHVLIPGRASVPSFLDNRKPLRGEPMRLWESEYEIPVHSPSSETVNEQLRRAESLPTDTREYTQDIHSVQGERGEGARMTGRGRESTKGQATTVVISSCRCGASDVIGTCRRGGGNQSHGAPKSVLGNVTKLRFLQDRLPEISSLCCACVGVGGVIPGPRPYPRSGTKI